MLSFPFTLGISNWQIALSIQKEEKVKKNKLSYSEKHPEDLVSLDLQRDPSITVQWKISANRNE